MPAPSPPPHQRQNPALLQAVALTKHYDHQVALAEVSLSVQAGEALGLIGPNGAGKTTLLEAIAGVLPVDAGHVLWCGMPLARRRDYVFYLPDGVRPYGDQYVERVLSFFAGVYRRPAKHVDDVASAVGLTPVRAQRIRSLSKGFARRLMWALGLLTPHPVLLMDEPFDGFDLKQTREMMAVPVAQFNPHILVMQSAKDRTAEYEANRLDGAGNRRVLVQGQVRARLIVVAEVAYRSR